MRIEKKKRFDDRLFVSNFTKALFCRVNCALKKLKGVDKRSRFTAPPTVPTTVLDDESGSRREEPFFVETYSKGFWKGGPEALSSRNRPLPLFAFFVHKEGADSRPVHGKGRDFWSLSSTYDESHHKKKEKRRKKSTSKKKKKTTNTTTPTTLTTETEELTKTLVFLSLFSTFCPIFR